MAHPLRAREGQRIGLEVFDVGSWVASGVNVEIMASVAEDVRGGSLWAFQSHGGGSRYARSSALEEAAISAKKARISEGR